MSYHCISFLLLSLSFSPLFAQFQKGESSIGGTLNYRTLERVNGQNQNPLVRTSYTSRSFSITPGYLWFFTPKVAGSFQFTYTSGKGYTPSDGTRPGINSIGAGLAFYPGFRYHFPLLEKIKLFVQGNVYAGVNRSQLAFEDDPENPFRTQTYLNAGLELNPGILFMLSRKIGAEVSFRMLRMSFSMEKNGAAEWRYTDSILDFGFNSSSFQLGVRYYFRKKTADGC